MEEIISKSPKETIKLAGQFSKSLEGKEGPVIVELVGDLGAGKTTFMKGVAKFFDVKEEVVSPTFLIQKVYKIGRPGKFKHLIHMDAYRLEKPEELKTIAWEKYSNDPENIIFIEWPTNLGTDISNISNSKRVEFVHKDEKERQIKFS